jgi:hypothetical protein
VILGDLVDLGIYGKTMLRFGYLWVNMASLWLTGFLRWMKKADGMSRGLFIILLQHLSLTN